MTTERMRAVGLGAGGHARVVCEALRRLGSVEIHGLLTPDSARWGQDVNGVLVLGDDELLPKLARQDGIESAFVAVGNLTLRRTLYERAKTLNLIMLRIAHPSASLSPMATVSDGVQLLAHAVVNTSAGIGPNAIVNTGAIVEHDCSVGAHSHIAPGAVLCGGVRVGEETLIGAGAVVLEGVQVGHGCVVGAGAVVTRDVADGNTARGVPAKQFFLGHHMV